MMRLTSNFRLILLACTVLVLSACAGAVPPTATPPPTPTPLPPTPTKVIPPTDNFPPTWTPGPPPSDTPIGTQATATDSTQGLGPTFPPSWTPVVYESPTPIPLPTDVPPPSPTLTPAISPTPSLKDGPPTPPRDANYSAACTSFAPGKGVDAPVYLGGSATITWTAVKGVDYYEFWLQNPGLGYILRQQLTDTKIVIDQKLLVALGAYGWEVIAYKNKDRMCQSVNGFIRVAAPAK